MSDDYLIRDSEATTITFASDFVEAKPGDGTLSVNVDDSFVHAYTIRANDITTNGW